MRGVKRVTTEKVQGEGSYIDLRPIKWGTAKRFDKLQGENGNQQKRTEETDKLVIESILGWNWKDDDGNPLPLPKDDESVIDDLTIDEMVLIMNAIMPEVASKN